MQTASGDLNSIPDFSRFSTRGVLVPFAWVFTEVISKFILYRNESIRVGWCIFLDGDIRPNFSIFGVDFEPFLQPALGIGLDRFGGAFWLTYAAIDAFIGVDYQHILTLIKTVDRADFNAVCVFAFNTCFGNDISHWVPYLLTFRL
jgi:hypothetical protein